MLRIGSDIRTLCVPLLATFCTSCATTQPPPPEVGGITCVFNETDVKQWGVQVGGNMAVAPDGTVMIQGGRYVRDLVGGRTVNKSPLRLQYDFDVSGDGTVCLVHGRAFGYMSDGVFEKLTQLPGDGFRVAASPTTTTIFLYGPLDEKGSVVFRVRERENGDLVVRQMLTVEGFIPALAVYGQDAVFAQGNGVFQVGTITDQKAGLLRLASLDTTSHVLSLAVDQDRGIVFASTVELTFAIRGDIVAPILGFGGNLALGGSRNEHLYVYQTDRHRAFRVDLPKLLAVLSQREKTTGQ